MFKEWRSSWAIRILSVISLLGMKAVWFSEIIRCSQGFRRSARTLEINLYATLHKLIGLKFFGGVGDSVFGMRHIWV